MANKILSSIDNYQKSNKSTAFLFGVIKKYSEDNGSYLSALVAYYTVLSIFPLLLVFYEVVELLPSSSGLKSSMAAAINRYFPVLGSQIASGVHSPGKTGLALGISILITLYGARGGASAFIYSISQIWKIDYTKRHTFPKSILISLELIGVAGIGLLIASSLAGFSIAGRSMVTAIISNLVSAAIIWLTLIALVRIAIPGKQKLRDYATGSAMAAVLIQIIEIAGNLILKNELKKLSGVYGTFALALGLIFWVYLLTEVTFYGIEIDSVKKLRLYPRSLTRELTLPDEIAMSDDAKTQKRHPEEEVNVKFN